MTYIFVAASRGSSMRSLQYVDALVDVGLLGDRYADAAVRRGPDYQVTLIELENIQAFARDTGLALAPEQPRRNLVTTGVRLNQLCGKTFRVGAATLQGLELCEPCGLFSKRTYAQALTYFKERGGLRARVIAGGTINVGDSIAAVA